MSETHSVECLGCGRLRTVERRAGERLDAGECPRCGYLGWALAAELTEPTRRFLRKSPPERRSGRERLNAF